MKGSSLLGLMKMDPYVSFRIGHVCYDTATAPGGGKNPQWKASYRMSEKASFLIFFLELFFRLVIYSKAWIE